MLINYCITEEDSFYKLKPTWNSLLEKDDNNSFFLTWEWISTWWEVYGTDYSLLILVAENENREIVGIAPLMLGKGSGRFSQHIRKLMFIGQNTDVTPEYLNFIIAPTYESQVIELFAKSIASFSGKAWDVVYLQRLLMPSDKISLLVASLNRYEIKMKMQNESVCRYVELGNDWESFLKSKSQHFRKRWNNTRNRLFNEGDIVYQFVPQDVPLEIAYSNLLKLNRERWGDDGASFRSDSYIHFHRLLCERIQPKGWLILLQMVQKDKIIATKYDYLYAGKIWGNQGGWSKEFQKKKVGEVMIAKLLEWGIQNGVKEYDFLGGDAEYKARWSTAHRMMVDCVAFSATWRGKGIQILAGLKDWIKRQLPQQFLDKIKHIISCLFVCSMGGVAWKK